MVAPTGKTQVSVAVHIARQHQSICGIYHLRLSITHSFGLGVVIGHQEDFVPIDEDMTVCIPQDFAQCRTDLGGGAVPDGGYNLAVSNP